MLPSHLRMARAAFDWTLRDLEDLSGVNRNTISRYESGKEIMSGNLRELERVLAERGVTFIEEKEKIGILVQSPIAQALTQNGKSPILKKRSQKKK